MRGRPGVFMDRDGCLTEEEGYVQPDHVAADLGAAVDWALERAMRGAGAR